MAKTINPYGSASGGSGTNFIEEFVISGSISWSPYRDCIADITVIGGGASGAAISSGGQGSGSAAASGGGAGGCARSFKIPLSSLVSYTAVIGSGGVAASSLFQDLGNNGGQTSFSGADIITMLGNGGNGGLGTRSTSTISANISGGIGGTASGGELNFVGGSGGDAIIGSGGGASASGGGAVGIYEQGKNGGTANKTFGNGSVKVASGGAGVGNNGEDAIGGDLFTKAGSSSLGGLAINRFGDWSNILNPKGGTGEEGSGTNGDITLISVDQIAIVAGTFGGSGGVACYSGNGNMQINDTIVIGGGGTGGCARTSSNLSSTARGQSGMIIIQILEYV